MKTHMLQRSTLLLILTLLSPMVWADKVQPSATMPDGGKPEHVYTMMNGNNVYANALTAPTQTAENYGLFAFYEAEVYGWRHGTAPNRHSHSATVQTMHRPWP